MAEHVYFGGARLCWAGTPVLDRHFGLRPPANTRLANASPPPQGSCPHRLPQRPVAPPSCPHREPYGEPRPPRTRPLSLLLTALVPAEQGKAAKQRRALDLKRKAERAALREGPSLPDPPPAPVDVVDDEASIVLQSAAPSLFGLEMYPVSSEEEEAALSWAVRESTWLANEPRLTDEEADAFALRSQANELLDKMCPFCFDEKPLLSMACQGSRGLHRGCRECLEQMRAAVVDDPQNHGIRTRGRAPDGTLRDIWALRCPWDYRPFAAAWCPILGDLVALEVAPA